MTEKSSGVDDQVKPRSLSARDKIISAISDKLVPETIIPKHQRLAILSNEQKALLQDIEDKAIIEFTGQMDELESALGMLRLGHHMGWRVLYMVHSKKTVRKYEEILNIKVRDIFPEKGPSAGRSTGLAIAEKFSNFWKVVSGEVKIDRRREIE